MAPIKVSEKEANKAMENVSPKAKKIKIAGNAVILTSTLKFEEIKKLEKYNRDALCLVEFKNDEEHEVFRIQTGKCSSISEYGIVFTEANTAGYATATVLLPERTTDKVAYVKDNFGTAMFKLSDLEDAVKTALAQIEAAYAQLDNDIEEV